MFAAASKSGRAGSAAPTTDATFAYVPLLLETGSASSLNTTVTDSSASPNTVTRVSNPSTGWVSPYQTDGYWGNQFNGSNAYLSLASSSNLFFGTKDYTFECWIYMTTVSGAYQTIFGASATGGPIFNIVSGTSIALNPFGLGPTVSQSFTFVANTWYHIAFTRASNVTRVYVNGNQIGSNVIDATNYTQTAMTVASAGAGQYFPGYISNLRILLNTALYTGSTLTVPTAPLTAITNTALLTCQSNRFKDNGTANSGQPFTLTVNGTPQVTPYFYPSGFTAPAASPGAALFNGTSQYLSVPTSTAFGFGFGDYTIEAWVNSPNPATGTIQTIIDLRNTTGPSPVQINLTATGFPAAYNGTTYTSSVAIAASTWNHIALVRNGSGTNNCKLYLNGIQTAQFTDTSDYGSTHTCFIARNAFSAVEYFNGYLGNIRIVKGTAVYTGAFTPPSGPLTQNGGTYPSLTNVVTGFSAANTSLLLALSDSNYLSATNGVQNNTFIDESTNAFPITRNGTPTQGSITPYWPNGQWSNYFNGSSGYISTPNATSLQLNSSLWTIEGWFYVTSAAGTDRYLLVQQNGTVDANLNWFLRFTTANVVRLAVVTNVSVAVAVDSTTTVNPNTWYHIAASCDGAGAGANLRLWVNGIYQAGTTFNSAQLNTNAASTTVMSWPSASLFTAGYVSNVRILKGTALYTGTGAITVPTTPLTAITNTSLLTCQSNRFLDTNTQLTPKTITPTGTPTVQAFQPFSPTASYTTALYGGSGYFNGSTDYLSLATSTAFGFGTGDLTIECWVYTLNAASGSIQTIVDLRTTNTTIPIALQINGSGFPFAYNGSANTSSTAIASSTWNHVALVRSGSSTNNCKLYLNGVQVVQFTDANDWGSTDTCIIARNTSVAAEYFNGYIGNLRIVKGTAVYTGAFTPPTLAPLATTGPASAASYSSTTNVNTTFLTPASLLLNMANAGIYDAAVQNDVLTAGNAQVSIAQSQWPPSSMFFDGTGDYLYQSDSVGLRFGTGNYTIEFWAYPTGSFAGFPVFVEIGRPSATASVGLQIDINPSGNIVVYGGTSTATLLITSASTISTGNWYYIALVRSSAGTKLYINGSQSGSTATDTTNYNVANLWVGVNAGGSNGFYTGYLQDLRLTKGVARTITASPTAAFPTR